MISKRGAVTFETVRELAHAFPGVEDGTSYGTPALRVKKKFLARLREDGESVVFKVGFDEREMLMNAKPAVFYITDHYRDYPSVLLQTLASDETRRRNCRGIGVEVLGFETAERELRGQASVIREARSLER